MPEKKKKKKESKKAAALRKQKEEEERQRQEEEEKRRQEEEEERKRREEEERIQRENERIRLEKEQKRLKEEQTEFKEYEVDRNTRLKERWSQVKEKDDWEKYLKCEKLPDVDNTPDINAFLSMWEDSKLLNIDETLNQVQEGIELFRRVKEALDIAESRNSRHSKISHYENMLRTIYDLIIESIDSSTANIIMNANELLSEKESKLGRNFERIAYDLWVNLTKNPRLKSVEHSHSRTSNELTMKMSLMQIAFRVLRFKDDIITPIKSSRGKYYPIGSIFYIEILSLPPPKKQAGNNWTIRPITELSNRVQRQNYSKSDKLSGSNETQPITITHEVDEDIIIHKDQPSVGWWDEENEQWSFEGIDDIEFDFQSRLLRFSTTQLTTTFAVLQRYDSILPFSHWYLTPTGRTQAIFCVGTNLPGQLSEFMFKLKDDKCKLVSPNVEKLQHLLHRYMSPRSLLNALAYSGINFIIKDSDVEDVQDLQPKERETESKTYYDMAFLGNVCHFASSKWNQSVDSDQLIFRVSKDFVDPLLWHSNDEYEIEESTNKYDQDEDVKNHHEALRFHALDNWYIASFDSIRCGFMNIGENEMEFKNEIEDENETHLNLFISYQQKNSVINTHVNSGDVLVTDTIKFLLESIRPLSWC
eukprot:gb/GECH01005387.1/.p1 GENE.gb/GECH01005387.1/~~gb/GECH01005387.1/.p1  ORF type:complete len:646 (+),score=179.90 gb/GECH01005387.1/:1-1938(+)